MENRYIFNNIRLVFGILDYSYVILDALFVPLLDFCKAFHSTEHKLIFLFFKKFIFCDTSCSAVKSLDSNANSSIRMKKDTTSTLHPNRSVRQGCPISSHLFLICTQILASHISKTRVYLHRQVDQKQWLDRWALTLTPRAHSIQHWYRIICKALTKIQKKNNSKINSFYLKRKSNCGKILQ